MISPCSLPRPTPAPGIMMMFSYFMLYNYVCLFFTYIYTHICVHVFQRKHWWTLISFWSDELEKVGQSGKNVLKKKYKSTDKLLIYKCICVYFGIIVIFKVCILYYNSSPFLYPMHSLSFTFLTEL